MPYSAQDNNGLNHSSGRIEWLSIEDEKIVEGLWVSPLKSGLTLTAQEFEINGKALALSSSPWFKYNIYIMYNFNTMGSKPGYCKISQNDMDEDGMTYYWNLLKELEGLVI